MEKQDNLLWTGSHLCLKVLALDEGSGELGSGNSVSSFAKWAPLEVVLYVTREATYKELDLSRNQRAVIRPSHTPWCGPAQSPGVWLCEPPLPPSSPLSWPQTLYVNALCALEQLMEGLVQRQLDPKGLQEMVHVSCLAEGEEPGMATPPRTLV